MKLKEYKIFLLFVAVVVCAYYVRATIYERESATIAIEYKRAFGKDIHFTPFMVESAMMYSYTKDVGCGAGIDEFDSSLVGMNKISVHRQFTTALEYFLGYGYRVKQWLSPSTPEEIAPTDYEDNPDFTNWIRIQLRWWISLISGFIFLILIVLRIPWKIALLGGVLHAVSTAAIARYTAQDIVRGNFSLPFIVATFLAAIWFLRTPSFKKLCLTGILSFAALATWDMTQICFSLWALSEIVRLISGGIANRKRKQLWIGLFISAIFAAILIPYHREHNLIISPMVMIMFPLVIALQNLLPGRPLKMRIAKFAIAIFALYGIWFAATKLTSFGANYSHFAELMKAKIRFLNVKPPNPDLLSFEARSVWVPAMHSADRDITRSYFPLILTLTGLVLLLSVIIKPIRKAFRRNMGVAQFALFMAVFYSLTFFLLVRYHVFAIIFLTILLPIMLHIWLKNAKYLTLQHSIKAVSVIILYFMIYNIYFKGVLTPKTVLFSAYHPLLGLGIATLAILFAALIYFLIKKQKPKLIFYGKGLIISIVIALLAFEVDALQQQRIYSKHLFPQVAALIKWMRCERVDQPILADFELSPLLKAYCNSKIILQPKFELGKTRENYKKFMHIMFHEDENEFLKFCVEKGAKYFIFNRGYAQTPSWNIYSPMYMAAAHKLKEDCPANMMDLQQNRNRLRSFYEIKPPQSLQLISMRFIIYKVISDNDKAMALKWAEDAEKMMRDGQYEIAARLAKAAIYADPNCPQADIMYRKMYRRSPDIYLRGY